MTWKNRNSKGIPKWLPFAVIYSLVYPSFPLYNNRDEGAHSIIRLRRRRLGLIPGMRSQQELCDEERNKKPWDPFRKTVTRDPRSDKKQPRELRHLRKYILEKEVNLCNLYNLYCRKTKLLNLYSRFYTVIFEKSLSDFIGILQRRKVRTP